MWLEAAHAVTDAQVDAVGTRSPDAAEFASAAKAYVSRYGPELVQDCVHLHGGIGVTFEHDIHLVLRRVTLNSALLGTAAEHLQILTDIAERKERRS
jgi:alkylation response protein AidB-like acyl-CoA dehydrogenase